MSKPAIFKNELYQQEFDQNGFIKLRIFSDAQIEKLRDFYAATQSEHETIIDKKKFHATNETDNAKLIADADRFIKEVMMPEVEKHFHHYKVIAANYLVKQPSEESVLRPHQDLRFVDENRFYSLNIWVPTQQVNQQNGCLRFLKGSHLFFDTIRPLPSYPWKYRNMEDVILQHFTDVPVEPGECVVLNHACIHASYPNLSGRPRVAAILAMVPQEAEILHYFLPEGNPDNAVEEYAMTLDDFVNLKGGQRPEKAPLLRSFKYDFSAVSADEFKLKLGINENRNKSLLTNGYLYARKKLSTLFGIS